MSETSETDRFRAEHERERAEIVAACERLGYGNVLHNAARAWADKPDMGKRPMGIWLRALADEIDPDDRWENVGEHGDPR